MKLDIENASMLKRIFLKLNKDHRRYGLVKLLADEFCVSVRQANRVINSQCPIVKRETFQ